MIRITILFFIAAGGLLAAGLLQSGYAGDSDSGHVPQAAGAMQTQHAGRFAKPSDEVLRERLTPLQYKVTQQEGTERPFNNEYWDNKQAGIYVDIVSGEPLFSSTDKFKSGTGWPSFIRPISENALVEHGDTRFFMKRTELRSRIGESHLGHVFNDGPAPTGLRYCINSASLRFIPSEKLEKEGYADYQSLFNEE